MKKVNILALLCSLFFCSAGYAQSYREHDDTLVYGELLGDRGIIVEQSDRYEHLSTRNTQACDANSSVTFSISSSYSSPKQLLASRQIRFSTSSTRLYIEGFPSQVKNFSREEYTELQLSLVHFEAVAGRAADSCNYEDYGDSWAWTCQSEGQFCWCKHEKNGTGTECDCTTNSC